jgi:hypothetical protein
MSGCHPPDRNLALEYRVRKQREDQMKEIIRECEERQALRKDLI